MHILTLFSLYTIEVPQSYHQRTHQPVSTELPDSCHQLTPPPIPDVTTTPRNHEPSFHTGNHPDGIHHDVRAVPSQHAYVSRHESAGVLGDRHVSAGTSRLLYPPLALPTTRHFSARGRHYRLLLVCVKIAYL